MAIGRTNIIAANLKLTSGLGRKDVRGYLGQLGTHPALQSSSTRVRVYASFGVLQGLKNDAAGRVALGVKNFHLDNTHPSVEDLRQMKIWHALIGRSGTEHGVTDAAVAQKLKAALAMDIFATVCVGAKTHDDLAEQVREGIIPALNTQSRKLSGKGPDHRFDIAYLPGRQPFQMTDIEAAFAVIKEILWEGGHQSIVDHGDFLFGLGGSVKPENAPELLRQPFIHGLLVRTASRSANNLIEMIDLAERIGSSA